MCDWCSEVDGVLFFVPSSNYIEIVGMEICALPAEICLIFGQKFIVSAKITFFILQSLFVH